MERIICFYRMWLQNNFLNFYGAAALRKKIQDIVHINRFYTISVYVLFRACLKNHSCQLYAPLCGIFGPHSVNAARCASLIQVKSPAKCDAHLTESIFQTRSSAAVPFIGIACAGGQLFHGKRMNV